MAWTLRRYFANDVCYDLVRDRGRAEDRSEVSEDGCGARVCGRGPDRRDRTDRTGQGWASACMG